MKTSHIILLMAAAFVVLVVGFGLIFTMGNQEHDFEMKSAADAAIEAGETPTVADQAPAMQLDVYPGVTKTRERLNNIERGRESLNEYAGEDGAEKY